MFFSRQKSRMPTQAEALPGRQEPMPVPDRHAVLGTPLQPPFPDGLEQALFALGCFWGALQRFMAERADATIVEVAASHVSFVSQPEAATQLILQAVEATAAAR